MPMRATAFAVLLMIATARGATPDASPELSLSTIRVTAAEVHLTFTVSEEKNRPVTNLSASDFVLIRDGSPVEEIALERFHDAPLSLLVLTDVSDSMERSLPLERTAAEWLTSQADASRDRIAAIDFGKSVESGRAAKPDDRHLTSLYDSLMETLPRVPRRESGRRAMIVLTDGFDNDSYHSLRDVILLAQRQDVAIYAITAHPGKKQDYLPQVLQWLCEQTGGRYYEVSQAAKMVSAVSEIYNELRNGYEVVFRPDGEGTGMRRVTIRAVDPHLHFSYRTAYFQPYATREVATR